MLEVKHYKDGYPGDTWGAVHSKEHNSGSQEMENGKNYFVELCQFVTVCKCQKGKHRSEKEDNGNISKSETNVL